MEDPRKKVNKILKKLLYKYQHSIEIRNPNKNCNHYRYDITIYIPFLKVSNIFNISTDVKRLSIKFGIKVYKDCNLYHLFTDILGKVDLMSEKQYHNHYKHSHLDPLFGKINNYSIFCIGSYLKSNLKANTIETLPLFIHSLFNYLKYEDLEGGPYRKLMNSNDACLFGPPIQYRRLLSKKDTIELIKITRVVVSCGDIIFRTPTSAKEIITIEKYPGLYFSKLNNQFIGNRKELGTLPIGLKIYPSKLISEIQPPELNIENLDAVLKKSFHHYQNIKTDEYKRAIRTRNQDNTEQVGATREQGELSFEQSVPF